MPTLDFKGKQHIYAHHLSVPYRQLIPDESKSVSSGSDSGNLIIHGDNLHALKALLPTYAGRVKCIYIDPPYNTGNEGWVYNDRVNSPLMRQWLSENAAVDGEDLERHDKWLCMMWPRLQLLRELLAEDGLIFVSIDYNESHRLRMIMDEVFGEDLYKNALVVRRGTKNVQSQFDTIDALSIGHDTVLLYSKDPEMRLPKLMLTDDDEIPGKWDTFWRSTDRPTMRYEIFGQTPNEGQWRWSRERAFKAADNYADYLSQDEQHLTLDEYITRSRSEEGKDLDFARLGPDDTVQYYVSPRNYTILSDVWMDVRNTGRITPFPHEKHVDLLKRIIGWVTESDDLILDSFAGSGTTAQAVLELNNESGGNRRFILVECEEYADTLTAERVRRVIRGVEGSRINVLRQGLGGGFQYCTLGDEIGVETMLVGENLPDFKSLAAYLLYCATGVAVNPAGIQTAEAHDAGFFYETERVRYHMFYEPDAEWLRGEEGALNYSRASAIAEAAREVGKDAVVFAPVKFVSHEDILSLGITFCQLPYELTASRAQALEM